MKKRVFSMAAVLALMLTLTVNAAVRAEMLAPELYISGTTATCFVDYESAKSTDSVKITMKLWRGDSLVQSWTKSGTGSVSMTKTCTVTRGNTYELVVTPTVNGVVRPSVSVTDSN